MIMMMMVLAVRTVRCCWGFESSNYEWRVIDKLKTFPYERQTLTYFKEGWKQKHLRHRENRSRLASPAHGRLMMFGQHPRQQQQQQQLRTKKLRIDYSPWRVSSFCLSLCLWLRPLLSPLSLLVYEKPIGKIEQIFWTKSVYVAAFFSYPHSHTLSFQCLLCHTCVSSSFPFPTVYSILLKCISHLEILFFSISQKRQGCQVGRK